MRTRVTNDQVLLINSQYLFIICYCRQKQMTNYRTLIDNRHFRIKNNNLEITNVGSQISNKKPSLTKYNGQMIKNGLLITKNKGGK